MAPHSSTPPWKISWTEEPCRLQSMGSLGVGHDWANSLSLFTFMNWRRKWQPTPVFLPGESQGWGSLVGCPLWGRTESDTTEATEQQQLLLKLLQIAPTWDHQPLPEAFTTREGSPFSLYFKQQCQRLSMWIPQACDWAFPPLCSWGLCQAPQTGSWEFHLTFQPTCASTSCGGSVSWALLLLLLILRPS